MLNNIIETTKEHPFWIEEQGWTKAEFLKEGDVVRSEDGSGIEIEDVEIFELPEDEYVVVYNFEVTDFHSYYVSEFNVLVHNTCPYKKSLYEVGAYKDIKGVKGLDAHHVGQKALMKKFVKNYDPQKGPAINVPKVGHTISGPRGIVSRSTKGITSARQLLARDIMELRRVYPDIPNTKLRELIELNKKMYPEMRKK